MGKDVIRLTLYAEERLQGRRLSRELAARVLAEPQQVIEENDRYVAQSPYTDPEKGKEYLLRFIYDKASEDKLVITAYQTSKIWKCWRPE